MISLLESILKSTKTGIEGVVIRWFKENHILDPGIGFFHSKNHRNDYYSSLFLKNGKVCIDDNMMGSIDFSVLRDPKIPDYIKFGWCPGIGFTFDSEGTTSEQVPEVCDSLSFMIKENKMISFKSKLSSVFRASCYKKNKKIVVAPAEIEINSIRLNGDPKQFYISFSGDLDLRSLKNLVIKDPLKRGVIISIFRNKKPYVSINSRPTISNKNPDKLEKFIKKIAPGIPTLYMLSGIGDDSLGDPEIDKEFLDKEFLY